jgi:hypothetical protein
MGSLWQHVESRHKPDGVFLSDYSPLLGPRFERNSPGKPSGAPKIQWTPVGPLRAHYSTSS